MPARSCALGLVLALLGAWIAADSVGLMSHSLRGALCWSSLAGAALAMWNGSRRAALPAWGGGVASALVLMLLGNTLSRILAPAALCAAISLGSDAPRRKRLAAVAAGIAALAVFRFANESIPWFWLGADWVAELIGRIGGRVVGQRLSVGVSFAGLDFLVPVLVIAAAWWCNAGLRGWASFLWIILAIVAGHLAYLAALAWCPALLKALPAAEPKQPATWADAVRMLVPWNVPALAAVVHLLIVGAIVKRLEWGPEGSSSPATNSGDRSAGAAPVRALPYDESIVLPPESSSGVNPLRWAPLGMLMLAAVGLPVLSQLRLKAPAMSGKKVVAYEKGFLNWLKPSHDDYGRLSAGMYGLMPQYVQSMGAKFVKSPDLSEGDLAGASALVIIFPDKAWTKEQKARIDKFVLDGGSLLVLGEHTTHNPELYPDSAEGRPNMNRPVRGGVSEAPFNDLLEGTAMRVRFDSAFFTVGGWLHSYLAIAHPTQTGIGDDRNTFGVVTGASLKANFPARPMLIGRWGWNDPGEEGSAAAMMGNHHYDPGERLGDMILVSEQPVGKGKIVVFGDTSSFTNNITYGAHPYTSRLFAYLAAGGPAAHSGGGQIAAMILALLALAGLLAHRRPVDLLAFCVVFSAASALSAAATFRAQEQLPTSAPEKNVRVAYVAASNMEGYSSEALRPNGLMGMVHTLERNDYLPLSLSNLTLERLRGASVLISIAPGRRFSAAERRAVRRYIEEGGIFISTVGYDRAWASEELLAELGFHIAEEAPKPGSPAKVPQPMGHFKSPYLENPKNGQKAFVRFWAAWPVCSSDPQAQVIAFGRGGHNAIMMRRIGKGKAVVIGDTEFAMTKNLEMEEGQLIEGARENADFWRWLLPYLREDKEGWIPPQVKPRAEGDFELPEKPATRPAIRDSRGGGQ